MKHGSAGEEQDPDGATSAEQSGGAAGPGLAQTGHETRVRKRRAQAPASPNAAGPVSEKVAAGTSATAAAASDAEPEVPSDAYVVSLPMFEGPLDLLLSIIQKHELDILDIPVSFITEKYLAYLDVMRSLSIDVASEYLVMAATLAHIKSKMLLPEPPKDQDAAPGEEDEEDPRAELVRRLLEYQKYKAAAESLGSRDTLGSAVFARGGSEPVPEGPAPFSPVGTYDLLDAFAKLLGRTKQKIEHEIIFDRISISDRISELVDVLKSRRSMPFEELFSPNATRFELIITFLAVLEMARLKMMRVFQAEALSPIHVELLLIDDGVEDPLGMRQSQPPATQPQGESDGAAAKAEAEGRVEEEAEGEAEDAGPVTEPEGLSEPEPDLSEPEPDLSEAEPDLSEAEGLLPDLSEPEPSERAADIADLDLPDPDLHLAVGTEPELLAGPITEPAPAVDPEPAAEPDPEAELEPAVEPEAAAELAPETEAAELAPEHELAPATDPETAAELAPETEAAPEPEAAEPEPELAPATDPESAAEPEAAELTPETEAAELAPETEAAELAPEPEAEPTNDALALSEEPVSSDEAGSEPAGASDTEPPVDEAAPGGEPSEPGTRDDVPAAADEEEVEDSQAAPPPNGDDPR